LNPEKTQVKNILKILDAGRTGIHRYKLLNNKKMTYDLFKRECYPEESCVVRITDDKYIPCIYPLNRSPLQFKCLCKEIML